MNLLKAVRPLCFHLGIAALFDFALFVAYTLVDSVDGDASHQSFSSFSEEWALMPFVPRGPLLIVSHSFPLRSIL